MRISETLRTTRKCISRSGWSGLTPVLVMTLTFFMTTVFVVIGVGSKVVLDYLESKAQVTAFFRDEVSEGEILGMKQSLEEEKDLLAVNYVSKQDALQIYLGQHRDEPALLESISANIFPASLELRAKDINVLPTLAKSLREDARVEEVVFYEDVIETFRSWSRSLRLFGVGFIAVLATISVLIVLATIGIAIHTRSEEVEIMKLVGATNWYVQGPFLFQGAFYGLISVVMALGVLAALVPLALPRLGMLFRGVPLPTVAWWQVALVVGVELGLGVLLGVGGSLAAVRKYLKT